MLALEYRPRGQASHGPSAVQRSLRAGLTQLGIGFNENPVREECARVVYVPGGPDSLGRAIQWRREGRVDRILAGPNIVDDPDRGDRILQASEVDVAIVASDWVRQFFAAAAPRLAPKLRVCPAGVDIDAWRPSGGRRRVGLVYVKNSDTHDPSAVMDALAEAGLAPAIVRYGRYSPGEYRAVLDQTRLAVFLSTSETQGIALAEAWAMDVPTLVWNPRRPVRDWVVTVQSSSCPLLTPATGAEWVTLDELRSLLSRHNRAAETFGPREWTVENLSDVVCARRLLSIAFEQQATAGSL
ncbi:MAG: hypothetical protein K1Y01_05335 [Vicinamibacteria bacterium]|nr:hypothetical protein [Vicinamibacteria bacterium]